MDDAELERFMPELDIPLDRGIRRYVLKLRMAGIETFESCEGGEGHAFPEPTIRFYGNSGAGFKAISAGVDFGLPISSLRRVWDMIDGEVSGPWWEMTFRTTD
ncbi:MAG: hypothetical protein R3F54_21770 [Alphaproteobacteria bacterium]